jgi:riboflavin-specific deaminase-like protein
VWLQVDAAGSWTASTPVTPEARQLFDLYLPLQVPADIVIAQIGQSLDGRIATERGHSHYVTGEADIRRLHRVRALVDAVIVGAGTVESDNPRLTVREVEGSNPVRVVLDPHNRLEADRHVFSDCAARTLVFREGGGNARGSIDDDVIELPMSRERGFDPREVLHALRERGYRRVLVEGGGTTVSRFLQAGVIDRLHVTVAPLVIGSGRPGLSLEPIESLQQALRPRCRHFRLGEDVLFDLDFSRGESWTSPS